MAISNEVLKLISYICFGAGGVSAIVTIILFIVSKKSIQQTTDLFTIEEDFTSVNSQTYVE